MYDEFANLSTNALNVRVCENGRERFSGLGLFGVFFPTCLFWVCFCFFALVFFFLSQISEFSSMLITVKCKNMFTFKIMSFQRISTCKTCACPTLDKKTE